MAKKPWASVEFQDGSRVTNWRALPLLALLAPVVAPVMLGAAIVTAGVALDRAAEREARRRYERGDY